MMVEKININIPAQIGNDAIELVQHILDYEIKLLLYDECNHPKGVWACDECEDLAKHCNCTGSCNVECLNCNITLCGEDGHLLTCTDVFTDKKVLTFKETMQLEKSNLEAALVKELQRANKKRVEAALEKEMQEAKRENHDKILNDDVI